MLDETPRVTVPAGGYGRHQRGVAYEVSRRRWLGCRARSSREAPRYEVVFPSACNFLQQSKEANFKRALRGFTPVLALAQCDADVRRSDGYDEDKGYVNAAAKRQICGVLKPTLKGSATITISSRTGRRSDFKVILTLETDSEGE